jgi:amino acid adenylation domain-containing protein
MTALAAAADLARIAEFNQTDAAFPDEVTLQELIEAQVAQHPDDTAVICDGMPSLTYAQLNEKVNQLAHVLRAEGVGAGHVVALMVERSCAMIIGILGIVKAGAAYLPIAPDNPPNRTAYLLQDGGVTILLVHQKTAGRVAFNGKVIDLDDPSVYRGSTSNPSLVNTPRDLAYVIYTSGSTGKPKGVMVEHRSVVNRLHWMQRAYPIGKGDVILQKTPYCFDVSVWELFWWALQGATLCFLMPGAEGNPLRIVDTIKRHHVSVMHFVPSMLNVFLEYLDGKSASVLAGLASVRQVFASGEALTPSHVRKFNDIWGSQTGARLTNLYGPTEATVDVSYFDCPARNEVETIPIGRPIDNIRLYIIREGEQAAIGETGELCIAGVGLARGVLEQRGSHRGEVHRQSRQSWRTDLSDRRCGSLDARREHRVSRARGSPDQDPRTAHRARRDREHDSTMPGHQRLRGRGQEVLGERHPHRRLRGVQGGRGCRGREAARKGGPAGLHGPASIRTARSHPAHRERQGGSQGAAGAVDRSQASLDGRPNSISLLSAWPAGFPVRAPSTSSGTTWPPASNRSRDFRTKSSSRQASRPLTSLTRVM